MTGGVLVRLVGAGWDVGGESIVGPLDLTIPRRARLAVIGPSGAGKTTLLHLLGGWLAPSRGQVIVADSPGRRGRRRPRIALLPQHDDLVDGLRVVHNVAMGRLGDWSPARALLSLVVPQQRSVLDRALAAVELEGRGNDYPGQLSGGERQRVALARVLAAEPQLVLADEPASALDPRLREVAIGRLHELADNLGASLVASLHDLALVDERFDEVLVLRQGRLVWRGPPSALPGSRLESFYACAKP